MKKTAVKISGIITTLIFLLLLALSVFNLGNYFGIDFLKNISSSNSILNSVVFYVDFVFVTSIKMLIYLISKTIDPVLIGKIISAVLTGFGLIMFIWGIKEITISHKDDESFARCHKTCAFMVFTKFMFFAFITAVLVLCFVMEEFKNYAQDFSATLGLDNGFYFITGALILISFLLFILPASNFTKANKIADQNGVGERPTMQNTNNYQAPQGGYVPPQPTMQANMPPMPGYVPQTNFNQPNVTEQNTPNYAPTNMQQPTNDAQNAQQTMTIELVPGQNGVPQNITEKGLQDLQRLIRLKAMGSISEENYNAMWQKICQTNQN